MGLSEEHPATRWNQDNRVLAKHRAAARDAAAAEGGSGSGLGSRNLEPTDQPEAQDTPPPMTGAPRPPYGGPGAAGASLQAGLARNRDTEAGMLMGEDGTFEVGRDGVPRFTTTRGVVLAGDAALEANARRIEPAAVKALHTAVPGYGRLK